VVEAPSESSLEPGYPGVVLFVIVHSLPVSVARWGAVVSLKTLGGRFAAKKTLACCRTEAYNAGAHPQRGAF
jgi:hypothetical protein